MSWFHAIGDWFKSTDWFTTTTGCNPEAVSHNEEACSVLHDLVEYTENSSNRARKQNKSKKQRRSRYAFDVNDNGLDISGFVLHTDKHEGKRHKFRVYLDSNENGRFDKNDQLIGRTGLRNKLAAKGVGNLLDEDEIGQIEVKFKIPNSNASMRSYRQSREVSDGTSQTINLSSLGFKDSDGDRVAVMADGNVRHINDLIRSFSGEPTENASTGGEAGSLNTAPADVDGVMMDESYDYIDDPDWQKGWMEHCTGDAEPPYPEDCFFGSEYS